jgi:hypothetical protein
MRKDEFLPPEIALTRIAPRRPRASFLFSSVFGLALLLVCLAGCAPPASQSGDGSKQNQAASSDLPELTEEIIRERINDAFIRNVPEENAAAEPINWSFDEDEPKEIAVIEKQMDGKRAALVLDVKTRSAPNARNPRQLEGQIRTEWELRTGWALRRWEITKAENISMKYRNLPTKPPAQQSNP